MPASALPAFVEPLGDGVFCIDTGFHRPRFDAAYLLVDHGRAAFIDTGTNLAVPRLLAALEALGLAARCGGLGHPHARAPRPCRRRRPADARAAARAGCWCIRAGCATCSTRARCYQGALAVYGAEAMAREYGELIGVDAARATATQDGMTVPLGARTLRFADTPGHARHHHCIWDESSQAAGSPATPSA